MNENDKVLNAIKEMVFGKAALQAFKVDYNGLAPDQATVVKTLRCHEPNLWTVTVTKLTCNVYEDWELHREILTHRSFTDGDEALKFYGYKIGSVNLDNFKEQK